jgi:nucleotide-binding universal stress UspA family protein
MEEEADALASESVQLLVDEGISARGIVARGHVVDAILEAAETESVDLIVLGRRGLASEVKETEGYLPSGSGSVADRVALRAPCPVLVVG